MRLFSFQHKASKPDADKSASQHLSAPRAEGKASAERSLEDYFRQARTEPQSLLDGKELQRLASKPVAPAASRRSRREFTFAPKRYLLSLALVGGVCGAIGFATADIVERAAHEFLQLFHLSALTHDEHSAQEPLVSDTATALSLQPKRADGDGSATRLKKSSKALRTTKATIESDAEPFINAVAGIPQNASHEIQPTHFVTLTAKEFERLGFFLHKDGLVEIAYPLAKKESDGHDKNSHALFASLRIDERHRLRELKRPSNVPVSALPPSVAAAITRGEVKQSLRPFALTDTLGILPSALSSRHWESHSREELKHWSAIFEDISTDETRRHLHGDSAATLIALRLQTPAGTHSALRNLVLWHKVSPTLIAALPERIQEQMKTEMSVLALAHAPSSATRDVKERNAIAAPAAYYLAQTQALLPNAVALPTPIARAQAGKNFTASYILHEPRAVAIALYSIDGVLIQKWSAASAQSGQRRHQIFISERLSPGVYLLAFKTDRRETAIQYLFLE